MRRHGRTGLGALFILAIFLSFAACGEKKGRGEESGSETGVASVNYEMEYDCDMYTWVAQSIGYKLNMIATQVEYCISYAMYFINKEIEAAFLLHFCVI